MPFKIQAHRCRRDEPATSGFQDRFAIDPLLGCHRPGHHHPHGLPTQRARMTATPLKPSTFALILRTRHRFARRMAGLRVGSLGVMDFDFYHFADCQSVGIVAGRSPAGFDAHVSASPRPQVDLDNLKHKPKRGLTNKLKSLRDAEQFENLMTYKFLVPHQKVQFEIGITTLTSLF